MSKNMIVAMAFTAVGSVAICGVNETQLRELECICAYVPSDNLDAEERIPTPDDLIAKYSVTTNDIVLGLWALVAKYGSSETNAAKRVIRDGAVSFVGEYGGTNDLLSLRAILTNRADFAQDSAIGASISILRHSPELIPLARGIMTNSVVFSIRQRRWTNSLLLGMCTEGESDMYIADSAQHARIAMLFLEYAALDSEEPLGADYLACRLNPSYRHSQQRRDNLAKLRPPGLTGRRAELYDAAQRDAAQED